MLGWGVQGGRVWAKIGKHCERNNFALPAMQNNLREPIFAGICGLPSMELRLELQAIAWQLILQQVI